MGSRKATDRLLDDVSITLDSTLPISPGERDHEAAVELSTVQQRSLQRTIRLFLTDEARRRWEANPEAKPPLSSLEEHVLYWPSAPIYALGSPRVHLVEQQHRHPWHSFRLLKRPGQESIDRIYVFFNGLNEWRTLQTYYRLADLLFLNEERRRRRKDKAFGHATSACIIRPFPGHLTRHPFSSGFFKLPMAHYLEDAAELYRQFLRHMVETQWLLSALVPFEDIPLKTGLDLLARTKRAEHRAVADAITSAWSALRDADREAHEQVNAGGALSSSALPTPDLDLLTLQIERLRTCVNWRVAEPGWHETEISEVSFRPLSIHAIGYSMGGFVAQATMFTWPQVIATCTMLASGGSLSDVQAPFVHEEEWHYVLDRLLPDLENPAIARQIPVTPSTPSRTPEAIYGLPRGYYSAFRRAFDQVFLQRSLRRGEYKDWLEEYHERLFFVLGGRDPVVRAANVVDSSPDSGLNIIQISGLKHELHDREAHDWQKFWLPRVVTRTIEDFVRQREKGYYLRLRAHWNDAPPTPPARRAPGTGATGDKDHLGSRRDMPLEHFERAIVDTIGWMREVSSSDIHSRIPPEDYAPFLLIARNRVPVELFPDTFLSNYGIVRHYSEERVAAAEVWRRERRDKLLALGPRLRVLLPDRFEEIETLAVGGPLAQWPDATGGRDWSPEQTRTICLALRDMWGERLQMWNPSTRSADTLPDCWFFFSLGWMIRTKTRANKGWPGVATGIASTIDTLERALQRHKEDARSDPRGAQETLDETLQEWLKVVRIYKVSPAHTGARYAGYEILGIREMLDALKHVRQVIGTDKRAPG